MLPWECKIFYIVLHSLVLFNNKKGLDLCHLQLRRGGGRGQEAVKVFAHSSFNTVIAKWCVWARRLHPLLFRMPGGSSSRAIQGRKQQITLFSLNCRGWWDGTNIITCAGIRPVNRVSTHVLWRNILAQLRCSSSSWSCSRSFLQQGSNPRWSQMDNPVVKTHPVTPFATGLLGQCQCQPQPSAESGFTGEVWETLGSEEEGEGASPPALWPLLL